MAGESCVTLGLKHDQTNANLAVTGGQSQSICSQGCHCGGRAASLAEGDILWPASK